MVEKIRETYLFKHKEVEVCVVVDMEIKTNTYQLKDFNPDVPS